MTIVRRKRTSAGAEQKAAPWRDLAGWRPAAALALAVLIFYWIPLTDPNAIQLEIALHAFLACLGAFLLLLRLIPQRPAAFLGSLMYGFSGYFADHSSHVGMFSAASLMPWLLLCFHIALERCTARYTVL